ncbi:MAG TPA: metal-transporting ATPase, partial [Rhodospirillales bacterium]|nr:metal-transporting ATPase [Rhodospirillales bacterium]
WVRAIYAAVTVLVMGYPCALGMATPLALVRGGGAAAERGILIRSGEAFQLLKDLTHVAFDKTGTLTEGRPRLVAVEPAPGFEEKTVLALAAAAEAASEHPLAAAVQEAARAAGIRVPRASDFEAIPGMGLRAEVRGRAVLLGTPRLLAAQEVAIEPLRGALERHEARAHTAVLLAVDGRPAGLLAFADTVKEDARRAVERLRRMGITPVLLTGDNRRTAEAVAAEVGIADVRAGLLPPGKVEAVRRLQARGARVAMVGDGINDAPALMQAHVGMAIGAGTDIAIEAADVVLVGRRLLAVPDAVAIGGASYRKTVENLWLAFLFNGVGVPLAATGLLHPVWAMAAMAASVSTVLANSFGGRLTVEDGAPPAAPSSAAAAAELSLEVEGMRCRGCSATIEAALRARDGVLEVAADHGSGTVRLRHDPARVTAEQLRDALAGLGYRPRSPSPARRA